MRNRLNHHVHHLYRWLVALLVVTSSCSSQWRFGVGVVHAKDDDDDDSDHRRSVLRRKAVSQKIPPLKGVGTTEDTDDIFPDRAIPHNSTASKIINGVQATVNEFPSFAFPDNGYCGATLIWDDVLLTAAHCLVGFDAATSTKVYIGGTRMDGSNAVETATVDWALPYPSYTGRDCDTTLSGDIMLVFLKAATKATTAKAKWNSDAAFPTLRQACTTIGHGETASGDLSMTLRKATNLNVVDTAACAESFQQNALLFGLEHVCTSARPQSSCFGDSGGPLFSRTTNGTRVLIGVTSGGSGDCTNPNRPNRYTRVSSYADWIQRNICHFSVNPPTIASGLCTKYASPCGGPMVRTPETKCTFFGILPGTLVHKYSAATGNGRGTCTEQCYLLSPSKQGAVLRRGSLCGPCPAPRSDPCGNSGNNDDDA